MIDLYFWDTDNGYKARHMMEESGLEYKIIPINLFEREQFDPKYLKINPHHKIPVIVDPNGPNGQQVTLFESGAILKYIGSKMDNRLYPDDPMQQIEVDKWLFYGSAQFTTISQQYGFFMMRSPEDIPEAKAHYDKVMRDMYRSVDVALSDREYIAGEFSVADISIYSDTHIFGNDKWIGLSDYPNIKRWYNSISDRPAVKRAWGPF
ncbi:MAG: glutathione S-transferase [Rhodospirillaceae bacterium]|nr:glutathione S-transferase [Rhodospirillaceae bacterium]